MHEAQTIRETQRRRWEMITDRRTLIVRLLHDRHKRHVRATELSSHQSFVHVVLHMRVIYVCARGADNSRNSTSPVGGDPRSANSFTRLLHDRHKRHVRATELSSHRSIVHAALHVRVIYIFARSSDYSRNSTSPVGDDPRSANSYT